MGWLGLDSLHSVLLHYVVRRLTEIRFTTPMIIERIPAERMILQNAIPMASWLLAWLFRSPKTDTPRIIMIRDNIANPCSFPNIGQLRSKYPFSTVSSEMMRKTSCSI